MLLNVRKYIQWVIKNEEGQGMVEYALLVGLIAVVVIAVLVLLGPAIADQFQAILDAINPPTP